MKKWCKTCKKSARANRKEYLKMMDEQEQKRKIEMQRELFNRARSGPQGPSFSNSSSSSSSGSSGYQAHYENSDLDGGDDDLLGDLGGGHGHHLGHHRVETEEEKKHGEIFYSLLNGEEGEERKISQELQEQLVDFILNQTDSRLIRYL